MAMRWRAKRGPGPAKIGVGTGMRWEGCVWARKAGRGVLVCGDRGWQRPWPRLPPTPAHPRPPSHPAPPSPDHR